MRVYQYIIAADSIPLKLNKLAVPPSNSNNVIILFVTNCVAYEDRIVPIVTIAMERNFELHLISKSGTEKLASILPEQNYHKCPFRLKSVFYFSWAALKALNITKGTKTTVTTIEIATPMSTFFYRLLSLRPVTSFQFAVTPAYGTFFRKPWTFDESLYPLTILQKLTWTVRSFIDLLYQKIAVYTNVKFIVNSEHLAEDVSQSCANQRSVTIIANPLPHDGCNSQPSVTTRSGFLVVSNIQPYKGIGTILRAFRDYCNAGGTSDLTIVGAVSYIDRSWFENAILATPGIERRINYLGKVDKKRLYSLYSTSACLVHASYVEGSPRAITEAIICKLPVIAAAIPPVIEIKKDAGNLIRLFTPGSHVDLTDLMLKWDKGERWGGRESELESFAEKRSANAFGRKILDLVSSSS